MAIYLRDGHLLLRDGHLPQEHFIQGHGYLKVTATSGPLVTAEPWPPEEPWSPHSQGHFGSLGHHQDDRHVLLLTSGLQPPQADPTGSGSGNVLAPQPLQ